MKQNTKKISNKENKQGGEERLKEGGGEERPFTLVVTFPRSNFLRRASVLYLRSQPYLPQSETCKDYRFFRLPGHLQQSTEKRDSSQALSAACSHKSPIQKICVRKRGRKQDRLKRERDKGTVPYANHAYPVCQSCCTNRTFQLCWNICLGAVLVSYGMKCGEVCILHLPPTHE